MRRAHGRGRDPPGAAARRQRDRLHAQRPGRARARRSAGDDSVGGGARALGRAAGRRRRRHRQRPDGPVPAARAARRRRAPAGRGDRHPGRLHRRSRVEAGAGRVRSRAPGGARAARRQRDDRRGRQRDCERKRMSAAEERTPGVLYGVGLGPGDPELVTVKAARIIGAADVVAYHSARHGRSVARAIAEPYLRGDQIEEQLVYPVTTETTAHPGGYEGAIEEFYEQAAGRLMAHLAAGRDVVLLAEGDPLFYSSYMHMHKRISSRFSAVIVPGITSVSAASAALSMPLVEGNDGLTVLPGTLGAEELTRRLRGTDAAAIMKISRSYDGVRQALTESGRLEQARYVERASGGPRQVIDSAGDVDPASIPYMSLVIVPGAEAAAGTPAPALARGEQTPPEAAAGRVDVVGLGPAGRDWLTPQALAVLAAADDLVGYAPYVDRVPPNPRQRRHGSDNRVEAQRAEFALDLALRGRRVAVVSSGDPGVFAMATAVLEAAEA